MKFCKDCKHCTDIRFQDILCERPIGEQYVNLVTGEHTYVTVHRECKDERSPHWFIKACGPDGKYFEAKEVQDVES